MWRQQEATQKAQLEAQLTTEREILLAKQAQWEAEQVAKEAVVKAQWEAAQQQWQLEKEQSMAKQSEWEAKHATILAEKAAAETAAQLAQDALHAS